MEFIVAPQTKRLDSVFFAKETGKTLFMRDNDLIVGGCESQEEADALIEAHNPPPAVEPTLEQKLAKAGLSLEELKEALGL